VSPKKPTLEEVVNMEEKLPVAEPSPKKYVVGARVEIRRSNGQWVQGVVLEVHNKIVVVEYLDSGLKYQKKMPLRSQHLAPFGTNICEPEPKPDTNEPDNHIRAGYDLELHVEETDHRNKDEDDGFEVVKSKKNVSSPGLRVRPVESPKKEFIDTMRSDLTESPVENPKKKSGKNLDSVRSRECRKSMDSSRGSVKYGSEFGQSVYNPNNLIHPSKPTPDYEIGDFVQIRCSDGHWYRGKVLDLGEHACLVEYRRRKQKFQKKLPLRSKYLRIADDDDVNSVHSAASARSSQSRQIALKYLVGPEKEKKERREVEKKQTAKASESSLRRVISARRKTDPQKHFLRNKGV